MQESFTRLLVAMHTGLIAPSHRDSPALVAGSAPALRGGGAQWAASCAPPEAALPVPRCCPPAAGASTFLEIIIISPKIVMFHKHQRNMHKSELFML